MTILSRVILLRFISRLIRSLLKFSFFITHLAYLFELFLPDFMINVLSDDDSGKKNTDNDSVLVTGMNKKIDMALEAGKAVGQIAFMGVSTLACGVVFIKAINATPSPHGKTIVAASGVTTMFIASKAVGIIKALKGSSDKGEGGSNSNNFIMNVVQSDSSLFEQCLAYVPLTIFILKLLIITLSVEIFRKVLFFWISKLKYIPKKITHFVLKSLERLQSISFIYIAIIISIMWLNLFNLTVFLRCLQVVLPKAENYALLKIYLYYGLILTLIYFLLTILVVIILYGNHLLKMLSYLWRHIENQIGYNTRRAIASKSTQSQEFLLEKSNKAKIEGFILSRDSVSTRLFLAIVLISLWVVSLFLDYTYKQVLHYLERD